MLHLRYSAGFWISFDFRIHQSSEYARFLNMSGLHKVLNKILLIDVWQYSEYALGSEYVTVLNMLGSHKVGNNIFHHKYLTGFWICFELWKYQCYTEFCRKARHTCLTGFCVLNIQGLEYTRVVNMPKVHMVLHKLYF